MAEAVLEVCMYIYVRAKVVSLLTFLLLRIFTCFVENATLDHDNVKDK